MPLFRLNTDKFQNRERIFIDSDEQEEGSKNKYDAVYKFQKTYEKVQSIELVNFDIPKDIVPTFVEEQVTGNKIIPGNNVIDVRMRNYPAQTLELEFSVTFPPGKYDSVADLMADVPSLFNDAMDAEGDPFFTTTNNISWVATADPTIGTDIVGNLWYIYPEDTGDPDLLISWFLFGSGPNKRNSAAETMGFVPNQDVGGLFDYSVPSAAGFVTYPIPLRAVNIYAFRYVDVFIKEVDEHQPLARIFIFDNKDGNAYTTRRDVASNVRILDTEPLRRFTTLNVILRFEKNLLPPDVCDNEGYDLAFELIYLDPVQSMPSWTTQLIEY